MKSGSMPSCVAHSHISDTACVELRQEVVVVDADLFSYIHRGTHKHVQVHKCRYFYTDLTEKKRTPNHSCFL